MEIIQMYKSDDAEICVISDGHLLHLADKNDLEIEDAKVGSTVRPSQMNEVYLEIPISEIREMAIRSEIFVEPDTDEEESSSSDNDNEEEEEAALPDWEALAKEHFFAEHLSLDEGMELRVLAPVNVKIHWEEGEDAHWAPSNDGETLHSLLTANETLQAQVNSFDQRVKEYVRRIGEFVKEMNESGHEISQAEVYKYLDSCIFHSNGVSAEAAAE